MNAFIIKKKNLRYTSIPIYVWSNEDLIKAKFLSKQ